MRPFLVDLSLSDDEVEAGFRNYLSKHQFGVAASTHFDKQFQESVLPRLSGMRDLKEKGSNIEFRKELKFETRSLAVELNTNPPTLIGRIRKLFAG
jgi:hypothetical protein